MEQEKKEKLKKNDVKSTTTNKPRIIAVEENDAKGSLGFLNIILDALDKKLNEESNINEDKTTEKVNTSLLLKLFSGKLEAEEEPKIKIDKNENFKDNIEEALRESRKLGERLKDLLDDIDYE